MKYSHRGRSTALVAVPLFLALTTGAATAATAISLDTPVSGTISVAGEFDWYSVTTDTIGDLKVTQTAWPPYIETQIAVFGPNNQTQAQSNPVSAAAPGTYYIKVWSANNGVSAAVYTFNATLTKAGTGNDIDKGGNSASAPVPISLVVAVSDTIAASKETAGVQDVDWFTVTTDTVGDLAVTQTVWPPYIETRIAVFGPNVATLVQANPVTAAAPGTYYIKVWSANDGSSIAPYTFTAALTKAATGNDIDKGANSAAAAVSIGLGVAVSDTIAPSKETAGKQDVDWFQVVAPVVGDLTVTQTEWPPYLETRVAVFGPNDPSLVLGNPVLNAAPGTYYVKVWSANDGSSIAPYKLSVSQKSAPVTVLPDASVVPDAAGPADAADAPVVITLDARGGDDGYRSVDTREPVGLDALGPRDTALGTRDTALVMDAAGIVAIDGGLRRDAGAALDGSTSGSSADGDNSSGCSSCKLSGRGGAEGGPTALLVFAAALIFVHRRRRGER